MKAQRMFTRLLLAAIFIGNAAAEEKLDMCLAYDSNKPCYVLIHVDEENGRIVFGLLEIIDFKVDAEKRRKLLALLEKMKGLDGTDRGHDIRLFFESDGKVITIKDKLDGNERLKTYREIIKILDVKIMDGCEIPDHLKQ
jgi:hypothetical protein